MKYRVVIEKWDRREHVLDADTPEQAEADAIRQSLSDMFPDRPGECGTEVVEGATSVLDNGKWRFVRPDEYKEDQ